MTGILQTNLDPRTISALINGDRDAQAAIFGTLSRPVFTMARRVLNDAPAAEEVTQDTFIDVFTSAGDLREPERFLPWVRSIAVNHCLMRLRSPWHQRREALDTVEDRDQAVDAAPERGMDIESALQTLPNPARMIVWLYCIEGYRHEEIARAFDKSVSFSKSQLQRALAQLDSARRNPTMRAPPAPLPVSTQPEAPEPDFPADLLDTPRGLL